MKLRNIARGSALAFVACGMLFARPAWADYPERTITLIVPHEAGGPTDLMARVFAPFLAKYLGPSAKIAVENRVGAGGEVGWAEVARSKPDGYTLITFNTPSALTKTIDHKARYSLDQLQPIANLVSDNSILVIHCSEKTKTLKDFIAQAKERDRPTTIGISGVGASAHLLYLMLSEAADLKFTFAPFNGDSAALMRLRGSHVEGSATTTSMTGGGALSDGELCVLAIAADERIDLLPDVPTFKELGFEITNGADRGFVGPRGMPPEVLNKLVEASRKAVADPEFQAFAKAQALPINFMPAEKYQAYIDSYVSQLQELWKRNPWK
jgi:tripartite-type tricarboxylate transporter receptor subunit TctC